MLFFLIVLVIINSKERYNFVDCLDGLDDISIKFLFKLQKIIGREDFFKKFLRMSFIILEKVYSLGDLFMKF